MHKIFSFIGTDFREEYISAVNQLTCANPSIANYQVLILTGFIAGILALGISLLNLILRVKFNSTSIPLTITQFILVLLFGSSIAIQMRYLCGSVIKNPFELTEINVTQGGTILAILFLMMQVIILVAQTKESPKMGKVLIGLNLSATLLLIGYVFS